MGLAVLDTYCCDCRLLQLFFSVSRYCFVVSKANFSRFLLYVIIFLLPFLSLLQSDLVITLYTKANTGIWVFLFAYKQVILVFDL